MKVLNLQCQHLHQFEGWFASEEDYQQQHSKALIECPVCADTTIQKMLSAPRLNLHTSRTDVALPSDTNASPQATTNATPTEPAVVQPEQVQWLKMVQHVIANTEDVGAGFAEEARKMHYGETQERNIRGQASAEETRALLEEGIPGMPLPLPAALKGSVH
jgi:hypothetical protein